MKNYKLIGIAAVSENGVIGNGDRIPWKIPADLEFFKNTTLGHTLLMGRPTARSIGRPLPGRRTVIMTRNASAVDEACDIHGISPESGIAFLCGGSEIYAAYLFDCDELLITHVKLQAIGDKYFPYFFHKFDVDEVLRDEELFKIVRYKRKTDEDK